MLPFLPSLLGFARETMPPAATISRLLREVSGEVIAWVNVSALRPLTQSSRSYHLKISLRYLACHRAPAQFRADRHLVDRRQCGEQLPTSACPIGFRPALGRQGESHVLPQRLRDLTQNSIRCAPSCRFCVVVPKDVNIGESLRRPRDRRLILRHAANSYREGKLPYPAGDPRPLRAAASLCLFQHVAH